MSTTTTTGPSVTTVTKPLDLPKFAAKAASIVKLLGGFLGEVDGLAKGAGAQTDPNYQEEVQNICCDVDNLDGKDNEIIEKIKGADGEKYIKELTRMIKSVNSNIISTKGGSDTISGGSQIEDQVRSDLAIIMKSFLGDIAKKVEAAAKESKDPKIIEAVTRMKEVYDKNIKAEVAGSENIQNEDDDGTEEVEEPKNVPNPFGSVESKTPTTPTIASATATTSTAATAATAATGTTTATTPTTIPKSTTIPTIAPTTIPKSTTKLTPIQTPTGGIASLTPTVPPHLRGLNKFRSPKALRRGVKGGTRKVRS